MSIVVTTQLEDGVGELLLNRPDSFNSLDLPTVAALREGIATLREQRARVVILRAAGRAFCGGGDLGAFQQAPDIGAFVYELAESLHATLLELWELPAVVVSSVQGVAAGAGVPLAAAADIVVAARTARFDLAYLRAGLTPDGGSSLLSASIGLHRSLQLTLLGAALTADQAHQWGLVAEVVEPEELEGRVQEIAVQLRNGPHLAQVAARRLLRQRAIPDPAAALARETAAIVAAAHGPEASEGIAAFLGKRQPDFS